jgi:hypothetical protein
MEQARSIYFLFGDFNKRCAMTLPMWNSDWEKPDPLRGKRGWTFPDYVNIGIGVGFVVAALGFLALAVAKARDADSQVRWLNVQREQELTTLDHEK